MAVIECIQLIRNCGKFDSVAAGAQLPFARTTLLYAENGRGKTTLAAILRSLSSGDPKWILERRRLTATQLPHVVIKPAASAPLVFQNGAWSSTQSEVAIFDDMFVADNVCSGIAVETQHRQNLHELILGAQGVTLNAALQRHVVKIEEHNRELRIRGDAIPVTARGGLGIDEFCALQLNPDIANAIQTAERNLAAAKSADEVRRAKSFEAFHLPRFDVDATNKLLKRDLPDIDARAAEQVQAHFALIGRDAEQWIADGMHRVQGQGDAANCPFCAQDLRSSPLIAHYRSYFSTVYGELKRDIDSAIDTTQKLYGGDVPAAFERNVRVMDLSRQFWASFAAIPESGIDTAEIARAWKAAREAVLAELQKKQAAPLERASLCEETLKHIAVYHNLCAVAENVSASLVAMNASIALVKERAAASDPATLAGELSKLKATEARHSNAIEPLCEAYLAEKVAKVCTEALRDQARIALDNYRTTIFPAYETAINDCLDRFNAGFRLGSVSSQNTRGGSSCTYSVVINNVPVPLTAAVGGDPSFRNTLSAGDRNALALAFFFASLEQDPTIGQKIIVIDDPMTSLDEHRSLTTIHEMRRLSARVAQLIVLSHSKPFLCALWEGTDRTARAALKIARDNDGSTLVVWDVTRDCVTEHDRRHAKVVEYIRTSNATDERAVAAALRPILESYVRVAYPENFPPDSLLGPFIHMCQQRLGAADEVLDAANIAELRSILDYANRFHHDSNPAWETELINDQELRYFCQRTVRFTRR